MIYQYIKNLSFISLGNATEKPTAMIMLLVLFICLEASFTEAKRKSTPGPDGLTDELGKGVDIRKINLLGDFQEDQASIFASIPSKCFSKVDVPAIRSYYDYYKSTKDFYSNLAVSTGLDASLESTYTLGFTLTSIISSSHSSSSQVSGISLNVRSYKDKVLVSKDCLDDDSNTTLNNGVLKELESLPLTIKSPWYANSWKPYDVFINTFGSHVITSVIRGSMIKQTTFARSSKGYSEREFQVKSCVSLAGPTEGGKASVDACANVTSTERNHATHMDTMDQLIIKGGKKETRSALQKNRTAKLIEELLNEADDFPGSVHHTFRAIWEVLQSRFAIGTKNYIRAVNLQYYYFGFLNYGCRYQESGGVALQKFDKTPSFSAESPEYECTLAAQGCHSDDDCHYKPIWCSCHGSSCVRYVSKSLENGVKKEEAIANGNSDWGRYGCDWKVAGSYCDCYNDNRNKRKSVWRIKLRDRPHKDAGNDQLGSSSGQYQDPLPDTFSHEEKDE